MDSISQVSFAASDGYLLQGTCYSAGPDKPVLILNSATAVPQGFYRRFATHMQSRGLTVLTYDYRGIGASAPKNLHGFEAHVSDWGLKDIQGAVDHVVATLKPPKIYLMGHSAGGQQAGLITNPERIDAMMTVSAQSGYWRLQGGSEKIKVLFMVTVLIPILTRLFGYFPWSRLGGEDLPYHVALEWAAWCRSPGYLRDDTRLPLARYDQFTAPTRAYSIDDDDWGTKAAVHSMMSAYPNVTFDHLIPHDHGIKKMGHMGFFRKGSEQLWDQAAEWFTAR